MNLQDLPDFVLFKIFEYLPYDEVAKTRQVSHRMDEICQNVLNRGFSKVVRLHGNHLRRIKSMLPRRESERRIHNMAGHADILTAIETRLSMLSMTFCKHIDKGTCCFIPGRILDEMLRILRLIAVTTTKLKPHEMLDELRDLSSMAIEHFDEKVSKTLEQFNQRRFVQMDLPEELKIMGAGGRALGAYVTKAKNSNVPSSVIARDLMYNAVLQCSLDAEHIATGIPLAPLQCFSKISSIPSSSSETQCDANLVDNSSCEEARIANKKCAKFDLENAKYEVMIRNLRLKNNDEARRLQEALSTIENLTKEVSGLKQRLDDLDSKYLLLIGTLPKSAVSPLDLAMPHKNKNADEVPLELPPQISPSLATSSTNTDLDTRYTRLNAYAPIQTSPTNLVCPKRGLTANNSATTPTKALTNGLPRKKPKV